MSQPLIFSITLLQPTLPTDVQIMKTDRDTAQLVEAAASAAAPAITVPLEEDANA